MSDLNPYLLHEAVLTLYPAQGDGTLLGPAIWWGSLATKLALLDQLEDVRLAASGDAHATRHQVDEEHRISIGRTWILQKGNAASDFSPVRNGTYVLQMTWQAAGYWHQRTYLGVTCSEGRIESRGTLESGFDLVFEAQTFTPAGGAGSPTVYTPLPAGALADVPFFSEDILIPGNYLLGLYSWPAAVSALSASVIALASQNTDTILELEVNGVLTGYTLTLPAGAANTPVGPVTVNLNNLTIPAGQSVRWKVISGPLDAGSQADQAAVVLQLQTP